MFSINTIFYKLTCILYLWLIIVTFIWHNNVIIMSLWVYICDQFFVNYLVILKTFTTQSWHYNLHKLAELKYEQKCHCCIVQIKLSMDQLFVQIEHRSHSQNIYFLYVKQSSDYSPQTVHFWLVWHFGVIHICWLSMTSFTTYSPLLLSILMLLGHFNIIIFNHFIAIYKNNMIYSIDAL